MTIDGGAGSARGLTKHQKRVLRELSGEAYSAELAAELEKLSDELDRWKAGEIEPHDVAEAIHRFHAGPSRRLFQLYNSRNLLYPVARAVALGLIERSKVPGSILEGLEPMIALVREELRWEANGLC